ncbi:MAG TPA: UV DNA damage repair endonuclease UvsE [Myxococcota bacterium]|nr:UV DNA damage repair endonuclease UvsE [Myxococcota bacterium]HRY93548.1 UV DNA damage repair endonuclease UvsE [Myxococcota bacterium]HSA22506.1 UV DNA damage repair endonuclease UvsE [Myxococcota bacterium]
MRVGYPAINLELEPQGRAPTMISRSPDKVAQVIAKNLEVLERTLRFNAERGLLFFRLRPDLVPAPGLTGAPLDWAARFADRFRELGAFIRAHHMRINIHTHLATSLILKRPGDREESAQEIRHLAAVLDALELPDSDKVQLHVGPKHTDLDTSLRLFIEAVNGLEPGLRRRLALENDNNYCNLRACLRVHAETGLPIVFDVLHHEVDNAGERVREAQEQAAATWRPEDGPPMVDYSTQRPKVMPGKHAEHLDGARFHIYLEQTRGLDFDLMMEFKDREKSAVEGLRFLAEDARLARPY